MNPRTALGRYGEEVAAHCLAEAGLIVLERNWRCREGELDIVALDGDTLAVCEVKTRSQEGFQQPAEAVSAAKADRLRHLAERWLDERWPVHCARLAAQAPLEPSGYRAEPPGSRPSRAGVGGPPGPGRLPRPLQPAPPPPGGVRIDLVAVTGRRKGAALVEHLKGAV